MTAPIAPARLSPSQEKELDCTIKRLGIVLSGVLREMDELSRGNQSATDRLKWRRHRVERAMDALTVPGYEERQALDRAARSSNAAKARHYG